MSSLDDQIRLLVAGLSQRALMQPSVHSYDRVVHPCSSSHSGRFTVRGSHSDRFAAGPSHQRRSVYGRGYSPQYIGPSQDYGYDDDDEEGHDDGDEHDNYYDDKTKVP